ncbi:MAG: response regulator [Deltaproteobacteria bacterium]|nr:response regulator [Deltaproteobacteria bacterium]
MSDTIKVLMVDDEEQFRATTKKLLNRRGFETILAGSGEEAIEKLEENPNVVILDIKMPGMDGHEALREIKSRIPDVPVIMLTGHGDMPSAREALIEGAFDYLSKPCDIDILAAKINDACQIKKVEGVSEEKAVMDVMIPVEDYTTLKGNQTIGEAILRLKESFASKVSTSRIMETGHRSILVLDDKGQVDGVLSIRDLLQGIMPAYLGASKPSTADSIQYSPMFWDGMFTGAAKALAKKKIEDLMSPAPLTIDGGSNLMEAANMMVTNKVRRLVVTRSGQVAGVVREQDLFFEIERILIV